MLIKLTFEKNEARFMSNKKLIIRLIQQDLKHCQLLYGLIKIGLNGNDKHHLQILDIVYDLMNVPKEIEYDWGSTYHNYMKQALLLEVGNNDTQLKPLAELCYKHLKMLVDCEKKQLRL